MREEVRGGTVGGRDEVAEREGGRGTFEQQTNGIGNRTGAGGPGSVYGIVTCALTWLAFAAVYVTVKVSVWPLVSTSGKVSVAGTVTVIAVEPSD